METATETVTVVPVTTATTAKYPKTAVNAALQAWYGVVAQSEGLPANIPTFHFNALTVKLETLLMEAGVFVDYDGRLKANKEKTK